MWYNQFRPALRRPAQPEFALYHIFQKKSNKIFSSNCTIFFPEISFFCATRPCGRTPTQPPYATPFVWQPGPGRIYPPRRKGVGPSKIFLPVWRPAHRVNFPIWPQHCYKLGLLPAKIFLTLSPGKIGPIAKIERVQ